MSITLDVDEEETAGLRPDGRPDPAYAAALGLVPARAGKRSLAFIIDAAIFLVLISPVLWGSVPRILNIVLDEPDPSRWLSHPDFGLALLFYVIGQSAGTIYVFVQLIVHGRRGVTIGKAATGLRSVNAKTLAKPGFWRMALRALVFSAAFTLIPYLGSIPFLLSPLWDPEKRGRGWLDRVGGNWLVDIRAGFDPYDKKLMRLARKRVAAPEREEAAPLPSLATGTGWAGPSFVPSTRSSSGVVSAPHREDEEQPWAPPLVGASAPAPTTGAPATPTAPAAPTVRRWNLVFDDGLTIPVDGLLLLGRNPDRQGDDSARLIAVDDPTRQVSKTHLEVTADAEGVWITDRASSNGTALTAPGAGAVELEAWKRTNVRVGSTVALGGRTFRITEETTR